jgi:GTP-binding protein
VASRKQNTLVSFRDQKELQAEPGASGGKTKMNGRGGKDLLVHVPVGTEVRLANGDMIVDLQEDGQQAIIAKGGKGGFGNSHFLSSVRQAPNFAEKGEAGEELELTLELKLIADVGLVGLPNAGKSTLLSVISNARPEIADYPFTTLTPNLGVVDIDKESSLLFADIPGLIEGAAEGKGLGDEFLRHVERTAVLLHLIDAGGKDIVEDYTTIQNELKTYRTNLAKKPQIVILSKIDTVTPEQAVAQEKLLRKAIPKTAKLLAISAQAHKNLPALLYATRTMVQKERDKQLAQAPSEEELLPVLSLKDTATWQVTKTENAYVVSGSKIDRFASRTDFDNDEGVQRLRTIMRKTGIIHELRRQGALPGDKIQFAHGSFEY